MNKETLNDIADGLNRENPYCMELCQLGLRVQEGHLTGGVNVTPMMVDQSALLTVYTVMNCRQIGVTSLNLTTTNGSISDVKVNSEKVEGLCFPLLFPHREAGYTKIKRIVSVHHNM